MNKTELVEAIANGSNVTKAVASEVLAAFTQTVTDAVKSGHDVVIPGFGAFKPSNRPARVGRNPKTGEAIAIEAARRVQFKVGKALKEAVQNG